MFAFTILKLQSTVNRVVKQFMSVIVGVQLIGGRLLRLDPERHFLLSVELRLSIKILRLLALRLVYLLSLGGSFETFV